MNNQTFSTAPAPADYVAFKPTITRPNQANDNFWVRGPSGQIICEFEREADAIAFIAENKFSIKKNA